MGPDEKILRNRLRDAGLAPPFIDAAWPEWWSDEAATSASARNELRFALSRALGLDPRALIDGDRVDFVSSFGPRFKALGAKDDMERRAIASFGQAVVTLLGAAAPMGRPGRREAHVLRDFLLSNRTVPTFQSLIALCWRIGVPVVHLAITPLKARRMHAMAVGRGDRCAILVAVRDTVYAKAAFTVAHELGHIMLGHLEGEPAALDILDPLAEAPTAQEEREANRYALELLTGRPEPRITTSREDYSARQLARASQTTGAAERVEPATIALCDGYRTGNWARAMAACRLIQPDPANVAAETNAYARHHLDLDVLDADSRTYLRRVLGLPDDE